MGTNVEYLLQQKYNEYKLSGVVRTKELYENTGNIYFGKLLAILHQEFNRLFLFMFSKTNGHFNAGESRALISYTKLYEDLKYVLKTTAYAFEIKNEYSELIDKCKTFLVESNGSAIPGDLRKINLIEYEPIFEIIQTVKVPTSNVINQYSLKFIGEGSYAQVFKYKDEFYEKNYVVKRAKKELDFKELERFKKEFAVMKELHSPYVLDVYSYDDSKNQYYAEYADDTLYKFINKNNSTISFEFRKNIVKQIVKCFSYVHSKNYLHRDISFTNILLIHYDDVSVVKLADFGLVKEQDSTLTSFSSEVKGSLNDSNLAVVGFSNYAMVHETFALTRLIFFVMTGKYNLENIKDEKVRNFVLRGVNPDVDKRYQSVDELSSAYIKAFN